MCRVEELIADKMDSAWGQFCPRVLGERVGETINSFCTWGKVAGNNNNNNNNNNKWDFCSAHLPHKVGAQGALQ